MPEQEPMRILARLSPARPGEAAFRGMSVEQANEVLREYYQAQLQRRFPETEVTVSIEGDEPSVTVENAEDALRARAVRYEAQRMGLSVKWAFSTLGEGLPSTAR